jgi:spermidine synthase
MILLEDFDFNKSTLTCKTMEFYGSDKGTVAAGKGWHNYTIVYNKLFSHRFHETLRIFELGIGTTNPTIRSNMGINGKPGASLYGWRDLFPNSSIFAADIDKNILFESDRIKTMYCDQTSKESIHNLWKSSALEENFDIIIEDGLHTFQANVTFFENSIHKLRKNGYYIIEDIHDNDIVNFNTIIKTWEKTYPHLEFSLLKLPLSQNKHHNTLLVIHYKANTTKNLVYFCVFFNPDYFKLAELLLKSMRFYSGTQIKTMDFLIITAEEFIPRVKDLSALTEIPLLTHTASLKTIFEAACARLRIFDYPLLNTYEKILYIDTDILIKGDLGKFFEFPLEERVYAIESGTIASPSFGCQFFSESMDKSVKGFNSGTLLFPNSLNIRDLFSKIRGHCESYSDSKAPIPYCMDQPFINYHCIKSGLYNNTVLNPYVALFEDGDNISNEATAIVCHFSFPIGNVWHKHARMTKYFTKLLEARRKGLVGDVDIRGKIYSWGSGFIEFTDTGIKTKWGSGGYDSLGENWYNVFWSNHYHVIRLNAELTEYKGLRIHPNDFTVCSGKTLPLIDRNTFEDRKSMLQHYCKTIPNPKILEIGIFKGEFLDYLVQNSGASSIDGVDLFEGIGFSGDVDGNNSISYDVGKSYIDLTEKYKNNPAVRLYKSDSSTFLASVADNTYDIIYIDGDHSYEGSKKDLKQSYKKIKNGGYIMGHDYEMNMKKAKTSYDFGVKQAVDKFCEMYNQIILAKAMDGCVSFCIHIQKSSGIENSLIDKILEKKTHASF